MCGCLLVVDWFFVGCATTVVKGHPPNFDYFYIKNIFKEKLENGEEIKKLNEEIIKRGMDNEKYHKEKELLTKQESILAKDEIYWKQKSRENGLQAGD